MRRSINQKAISLHKNVPYNWYYRSINIDKNLFQKYVHGRRFSEVGKIIEPTGGKILDVGCADGMFSNVILEKSQAGSLTGIDVLGKSVTWASGHWKDQKLKFMVADAHKLPFKAKSFDAVFALEILEHVYKPLKVLEEIKRVLRKGGYAVFLVPSETLLFKIAWYFWTKYYRGKIWRETHIHAYGENFLLKLVKVIGFQKEVDKKIIFGTLHLIKVRKK